MRTMAVIDNLAWLDDWYRRQCDGTWEHSHGVRLDSTKDTPDKPGLRLTINLIGTSAEHAMPQRLSLDATDGDWISCRIYEQRFEGTGDPRKLEQIIGIFRTWVDRDQPIPK
ncbi:immunity 53 family protein [Acidipila rosea]|uniref:Immunity protein 53 of polymorphic toxin system n=1 Tax=Acidipila rosea TaxID=768535 RepID=A0A4R1LF30_9BACT|nr:immunity 53 family protein [Acidipila rosea]MBW4027560.1 rhodanese-related sulfurtransferase [Acidobacteriota bacterium]TCK75463.1 immunity protein 53 of polymorphic toxin system [Acidipila rosea]